MKAFLTSIAAIAILAAGFIYVLDARWQHRADEAFASSTGVRLPDHGNTHNLVGKDWYSAREH